MPKVKDLLVKTENPEFLDQTLQRFGAAVCGGGMPGGFTVIDGAYVVRCFGDSGFIKFIIENQGYGEVVKEYDELYKRT